MKFTDGYWHNKEGVMINCPAEIRDTGRESGSITVYAACRPIQRRGDTLNGTLLTAAYSSPMADVIRVRVFRHKGRLIKTPEFGINSFKDVKVEIAEDENSITLISGRLSVAVKKGQGWKVDFFQDGRRITGNGNKGTGHITMPDKTTFMREQLDLGVGECVYGLGERFTPFVKNGQVVDMWNEDGGTSSEIAYKNIPFYITNRGYGVLVNHPEKVSFEIASEQVERVQFSVPGEYLEYFIIGGGSIKQVLQNYTLLTGRPALPPAWSFGLWLTTSFTTSYDEATVSSFVDGMASRQIPLHVFHFDCFWMKEYQWCDFRWDRDVFPDPGAMLKRMKGKGLKICVWINPYIAQKSYLFDEGMENGYLVKTPEGDVWQWDRWQAGMGLVDFTNPSAVQWYKSKLRQLLEMGVDCFKTDFGERIPVDVRYYDGSDPVKMHNYYTFLYNKTVYELIKEVHGEQDAVVFARSATVGSQQFPVHWGGDCSASYESMAESLRGGLSLCLSGFAFWSHDISGFEKTAAPDLYKRWCAFGLLSTHSRLHGSESYRVPWLFDEEAVEVLRFFTRLKCRLMPYIYGMACEAARKGTPVMRAMIMEFEKDPACDYLDRQYMLGDSILVAPVFNKEGDASYYLPRGRWTNFLNGEATEGCRWIEEKHGFMSLPLMVRPNSIIAFGSEDGKPDYDYSEDTEFQVFELEDGGVAGTTVYGMSGEPEVNICMTRSGSSMFVERKGPAKPWAICLRGIASVTSAGGADFTNTSRGVVITPAVGCSNLIIEL